MSLGGTKHRAWSTAAIALVALLLTPASGWSWGRIGHRVSAMMAESRLTPAALAAVRSLVGQRVSLAGISTWADNQRGVPGSGPWHYVNVPITAPAYDPRYCLPNGCVVGVIAALKPILLDPRPARSDKRIALKFLVHFIQDLHQPLHVGDNRDRGGNNFQVRFLNVGTNLHRLWDSEIIEASGQRENAWVRELNALAAPRMAMQWSRGTEIDWANESLADAKRAYCFPGTDKLLRPGTRLGEDYFQFALPIIVRQVAKAGIRVAVVLNEIFR